jgi:septal ring factor EnvC (AmiA/AmiB activator)
MKELIEQVIGQIARALDISKDGAGSLLLVLAIFLFAWAVSWVFLPWTVYSKLNTSSERLSSISGKLTDLSDKLAQVRDDARICAEGFNRLNENVRCINAEIRQLGDKLSEKKA